MTRTARFTSVLAALALLPLLAACGGPTSPVPGKTPTGDATPTTTPISGPDAGPSDTLPHATDATCEDIAPAGTFDGLFSIPIVPVGPERTPAFISTSLDETWVVKRAGGLACEWQGAGSEVGSEGLSNFRGVRVLLTPIESGNWTEWASSQTDHGSDIVNCGDGLCRRDVHVNGWWLSFWGFEFESEYAQTLAIAASDAVVARVAALPAPRSIPHTSAPDCSTLLPVDRLGAALSSPASSVLVAHRSWLDLRDLVLSELGGSVCSIQIDGIDVAQIELLPDGETVEAAAVAAYNTIGGGAEELLAVPGLAQPGSLRPQVEGSGFDFTLQGDWVKVISYLGGVTSMTEQQSVVAIAAVMVAAR